MLSIVTLVAILATLIVNGLSNFFPPQGLNVGEIANTILQGVQITPANYAFAIWGVIYIALIAYGIYQLRPSQRQDPIIRRANLLLILACLAQIAWIYLFTLRLFTVSVLAMLVILLSLIGAYLQFGIGKTQVSRDRRWMAHIPFSIYLSWISVATIVNIASALYTADWNRWGINDTGWTVIMLLVGAILGAIVALKRSDAAFTLVFVWAYLAIAVRQWNVSAISITAIVSAVGLVALLVKKIPQSSEI